jgi:hypothetical protein
MYEEVVEETNGRTPSEQNMLESIRIGESQFQVWVHRELKGTFLSKEDAKEAAAHSWEHRVESPVIRFRKIYPASKYWLLEIQSPAGDRWMTSDTFILEVHVSRPIGIPYFG